MANVSKNETTYTQPARGDYVEGSTAKFGIAKFNKARFGKDSEFMAYSKIIKNETTYTNPAKS